MEGKYINPFNRDLFNVVNTAEKKGFVKGKEEGRAEGLEEGIAQGKEEGIRETKIRNARLIKAKGYPLQEIADIIGLPLEEINDL